MSDDLIIDLTNYKDRVGNRVMPDRYRVVVEDAESDTAKSGNPMVNLWLRIQGGDFDGATIVDRLVLTEKSMFRVVGFMQAIGLPTPRKRLKLNVRQFIGKVLDIDVEDGEPFNGRIKSEVRGYMRAEGVGGGGADLGDLGDEEPTSTADDLPEDISGPDPDSFETTAEEPRSKQSQGTDARPEPETASDPRLEEDVDLEDLEV